MISCNLDNLPEKEWYMSRPKKWPDELVAEVLHQRKFEKRKVNWLAERYDVPVDTVRDWIWPRKDRTPRTVEDTKVQQMRN